jgi:hypothetical protein
MTPKPVGAVSDRENTYEYPDAPANIWTRLRHAWAAFMGRKPRSGHTPIFSAYAELVDTAPSPLEPNTQGTRPSQRGLQPYNPQALPAAREQWQRGDWASLAALTLDELQDHPDRAKLALLAGTSLYRYGQTVQAKDYLIQSKKWGISESIIRKMLLATTHNTLSSAYAILGDEAKTKSHKQAFNQLSPVKRK